MLKGLLLLSSLTTIHISNTAYKKYAVQFRLPCCLAIDRSSLVAICRTGLILLVEPAVANIVVMAVSKCREISQSVGMSYEATVVRLDVNRKFNNFGAQSTEICPTELKTHIFT